MSPLIRRSKGNSDGLDPLFEAYHTLKKVFDAAEYVEAYEEEDGVARCVGEWLILPGSKERVDANDINPLNGLELWIVEHFRESQIPTKEADDT